MGVLTLVRYLFGDRRAILELGANRWAVVVGLLFVLSAGFAREYDGEDLSSEPWHLLLPLGASLAASFALFIFAFGGYFRWYGPAPPFLAAYGYFLGLFWLTAPLAWLYAIPYERFLSAAEATQANLATLALVSAWRVALMIRVLVVLLDYRAWAAFFTVMAFADGVALLALAFAPFPVLSIMGGVRLSESEQLLIGTASGVLLLGGCSLPIWFILSSVAFALCQPSWQAGRDPAAASARPGRGLWALAFGSVAVWALILPLTQSEQQLRSRVERAIGEGRIAEALAEMSGTGPDAFPPHWDPPPRFLTRQPREGMSMLLAVCNEIAEQPPAEWVREIYLHKLRRRFRDGYYIREGDLAELTRLLEGLPEGPALMAELEAERREELASRMRPYLLELKARGGLPKDAVKADANGKF